MGSRLYYVTIGCGLIVSMAMVICLMKSSFFGMNRIGDDRMISKLVLLMLLLTLFFAVLYISPQFDAILLKLNHSHFVLQVLARFFIMAVCCAVGFVLKHLKFDRTTSSCMDKDAKITLKIQYSLYSLLGFDVLALIISWERDEEVELGFFVAFLQLTLEIAVEISASYDHEPNIWFTLVTALFCVVMIFARRRKGKIENDTIRSGLKLLLTVVGVVFLYMCSFTDEQFEDSAEPTKGVFFIILGILLVLIVPHAAKFIDILAKGSREHFLVKALMGSTMLLIVSVLILLNKYPGFRIRPSCAVNHHADLFDLLSAGAFSAYALIISSQKQQPMELGIFSFSMELTMYICIETVSGKSPVLWFFCCFAFCVWLILIRSYLGSLREEKDDENSDGEEEVEAEQLEMNGIQVVPNDNEEVPPGPNNEHAISFNVDSGASEISEDGRRESLDQMEGTVAIAECTAAGHGDSQFP